MLSTSIRGSVAAAVLATTAIAGLGAAGVEPAQASCTTSDFWVRWSVAGVYNVPDGTVLADKHYGAWVTGPAGGTSGGWTKVWRGNGDLAYMRADALLFAGSCVAPYPPPPQ